MILDSLLELLFPSVCISCSKKVEAGNVICSSCFLKIPLHDTLFCGRCNARLPGGRKICHADFPYLLGAASNYDGAAKELVHQLKFRFIKSAARPLGELLANYTKKLPITLKNWLVVPLPLSPRRLRERGFNQSEEIAKIFAEKLNLLLVDGSLLRQKNSKPQSETKNAAERMENVSGCFSASNSDKVAGRSIILIDDVTTSGATFLEASRTLKSAGARRILALAATKA